MEHLGLSDNVFCLDTLIKSPETITERVDGLLQNLPAEQKKTKEIVARATRRNEEVVQSLLVAE